MKASDVAASASNAAFLACTNGSRKDLVNAAISTLDRVPVPKCFEIFPRQIVVFVRMPGCSSLDVFARYLSSSPLMVLSESFEMIVKTALTVCSRTTGATSVKPVTYLFLVAYQDNNLLAYHLREYLVVHNFLR